MTENRTSIPKQAPALHIILDEGSGIAWNVPDPSHHRHAVIDLMVAPDLSETFDVIVDHTRNVLGVLQRDKQKGRVP